MCFSLILWIRTCWTSCPWGSIQMCTRLCPLISWKERHWRPNIWKVSWTLYLHLGICLIMLLQYIMLLEYSQVPVLSSKSYFLMLYFFSPAKNQLEFCCHMLRGTIDPKEPPVYEYVKFIGNFKSLNNGELHYTNCLNLKLSFPVLKSNFLTFHLSLVPNCTRNGFDGVIQRSLHSAFEDRVCLIATVRLAKPQFIKVRNH